MRIFKLGIIKNAKASLHSYRLKRADRIRRRKDQDEWMKYIRSEFFDLTETTTKDTLRPFSMMKLSDMVKFIKPDIFLK